jgi:hypothetical protein
MLARRHLLAIALVLAALATSCKKSGPKPPAGNIAEMLSLPMLGGGMFDPAQLDGKRVLLNFWRPG